MPYDESLAARVRTALGSRSGLIEKKMFGGMAFLLGGNMCCGVSGSSLMVRLGPAGAAAALAEPHTKVFDMTGRPMKGWIVVSEDGLTSDAALAKWVARGAAFAETLPSK